MRVVRINLYRINFTKAFIKNMIFVERPILTDLA